MKVLENERNQGFFSHIILFCSGDDASLYYSHSCIYGLLAKMLTSSGRVINSFVLKNSLQGLTSLQKFFYKKILEGNESA